MLSAIIPARRDLLERAQALLDPAHFLDQTLRNIFVMLERYSDVTGAVLTREALGDLVRKADAGKVLLYEEAYDALAKQAIPDDTFLWSLGQMRELAAERRTGEALTGALQILHQGVTDSKGVTRMGHEEARSYILEELAEIERALTIQESPEGDTRTEGVAILKDYAERHQARLSGHDPGIELGIPELDKRLSGLQRGELDLFAAYAGEGKTTLSCQVAWHAAVVQHRNVVYMTTETLRPQVRRKLLARHSAHPQFALPDGIDTHDLKNGTVPEHMLPKLKEVVEDYTRNPVYGKLYVVQVPQAATVGRIDAKLRRIQRQFPIDLVIIDYLALLHSDRRRQSGREELTDIVKDAKVLAATFDDGRGVPIVSPWQFSRAGYDEALKTGFYTLRHLAETGEAEKSADIVVALLGKGDGVQMRHSELKCQCLKNRDGEKGEPLALDVDYALSVVKAKQSADEIAGLLDAV